MKVGAGYQIDVCALGIRQCVSEHSELDVYIKTASRQTVIPQNGYRWSQTTGYRKSEQLNMSKTRQRRQAREGKTQVISISEVFTRCLHPFQACTPFLIPRHSHPSIHMDPLKDGGSAGVMT